MTSKPDVSPAWLEAIPSFPTRREARHSGTTFAAGPFDTYATCPNCGTRVKLRAFSGNTEVEDVFDAVLTWMSGRGRTRPAGSGWRRSRPTRTDPGVAPPTELRLPGCGAKTPCTAPRDRHDRNRPRPRRRP